jgi:hypothetical protein
MNTTIKKLFLKETTNWKFWLLLAFLAKAVFFIFKIREAHLPYMDGFWGGNNCDVWWYLTPMDNLLKNGNYLPDFRLPGYGAIYLPFRLFFSAATACNIIIIIQLLLTSISVYVLALIAKSIFKSDNFFYATFYLFAISTYSNIADTNLMPEGLTASLLIFLVYFFIKYFTDYKKSILVISGFLMAWIIFLRPETALIIVFLYLILVVDCIKNKKKFVITLLFLVPFTIFDSIWIAHNYKFHKKIIPLSSVVPIKDSTSPYRPTDNTYIDPLFYFMRSWGGNLCWWEPKAEMRWFCINWNDGWIPTDSNKVDASIPDYIYTSKFNKDSLVNLRKIFILLGDTDSTISVTQRIYYIQYLSKKFEVYARSVQDEKPMLYYVKAPIILTKTFIINGNECTNNNWFLNFIPRLSQKYYYEEYLLQFFYSIFYIMTMTFGIIGIFLLSKNIFKFSIMGIIPFIAAAAFLAIPIIMHLTEGRHLIPYFPFILVCAIYAIHRMLAILRSLTSRAKK